MYQNKLLNDIRLEDLESEGREIAETVGLETYLKLVDLYGGGNLYIPKAKTITINKRNAGIQREYTGYNIALLMIKYNLSASQIRNIVAEKTKGISSGSGSEPHT